MSTTTRARCGSCQPPSRSAPTLPARTRSRDAGPPVAEHPAGADQQVDLAQVLAGALDDPALGADHHPRPPRVAAQGETDRGPGDRLVDVALVVVLGQVRRVVLPAGRRLGQVVQPRLGDGGDRRPAHAEVALDGPGDRGGRHHLAGQALPVDRRSLGVDLDDAVHVGGGAADVDDHHVAGARVLLVEAVGEQLDAGEHEVGGGAADHRREVGTRAEVLAADDVGQEHLPDRRAGGVGRQHPDPRDDVVGQHVRHRAEDLRDLVADLDVAGHDDRTAPAAGHQGPGGVEQRLGVAAVGATGQQHHVGPARASGRGARPADGPRSRRRRPPCRRWTARPGGRPPR